MKSETLLESTAAIHLLSWTGGNWVNLPVDQEKFFQMLMEKAGEAFISDQK